MSERIRRVDRERRDRAEAVRHWTVDDFHDRLAAAGITRAFVLFENGEFTLSHPKVLGPVQSLFELSQDFSRHEGVFIGREEGIPTLLLAFVHDTRRGLSQGGLRLRRYPNMEEVFVDGLRLAQGMTRKNALAGLHWGGGKGVIPISKAIEGEEFLTVGSPGRQRLFEAYGRFVASLGGIYYTAEDIGTNTGDMQAILGQNRFTTCVPPAVGGSGNPSPFTARGVFRAMQAAWFFLTGSDDLTGVRVAVQGAGHVGAPLIEELDDAGAKVWFTDMDEGRIAALTAQRPDLIAVPPDEILSLDVDVVAPCAIGAVIHADSIPRLRCRLICGAANNILREPLDAERLRERGIAFVPDYVSNRMGIINCADEWRGYLGEDVWVASERVYPDTLRVLKHARNLAVTTTEAADDLADAAAAELHPLLGHRGRRLVDYLIATDWRGVRPEARRSSTRAAFVPSLDEPAIRKAWESDGLFVGTGPAVVASPISTAAGPSLASFLAPLMADVRARAAELGDGLRPRRVLGSDHGGLAQQLTIETSLPYERDRYGRSEFVEMCRDRHHKGDAAIRSQLRQLGIGFDPSTWIDPMRESGRAAVRRLFHTLDDAGRIAQEKRLAHHCAHCRTVLVASDVARGTLSVDRCHIVRYSFADGSQIETTNFHPELIPAVVALVVDRDGPHAGRDGTSVLDPLGGRELPVRAFEGLGTPAALLVPAHGLRDEKIARALGIEERPTAFSPGQKPAREEVREDVLRRLGDRVLSQEGTWRIDAPRCRRCESPTSVAPSEQLFLDVEPAIGHLRRAIESGAVEFGDSCWRKRVLEYLDRWEPWCISRQQWWGHDLPADSTDVLSTWFSLAAWSLQGAGWPEDPTPEPMGEVHVEPDLLTRWVVPSQLVSILVTGRPIFHRVEVHGTVHIVERTLVEKEADGEESVSSALPDHDRFLHRTGRRPMRRRIGNVVEPSTLVTRFGADALRLGFLLCRGDRFEEAVVLSESRLRQARRVVNRMTEKVTGLFGLPETADAPRLADRWFAARSAGLVEPLEKAYAARTEARAAQLLVSFVDDLAHYASVAASRRQRGESPGSVRTTVADAFAILRPVFAPICPFTFEGLMIWTQRRRPEGVTPPVEPWLFSFLETLAGPDRPELRSSAEVGLEKDLEELRRLARNPRIEVNTLSPGEGWFQIGPCWIAGSDEGD